MTQPKAMTMTKTAGKCGHCDCRCDHTLASGVQGQTLPCCSTQSSHCGGGTDDAGGGPGAPDCLHHILQRTTMTMVGGEVGSSFSCGTGKDTWAEDVREMMMMLAGGRGFFLPSNTALWRGIFCIY